MKHLVKQYSTWISICFLCVILSSSLAISEEKTRSHLQGIDLSWHNGSVQWDKIEQKHFKFVILKATEGLDLKDKTFDDHWPKLKELGIIRGAYHFYVTEDDPAKQAKFFIESARLEPGDLIPIVDIEVVGHDTQGRLYPKLKQFLDALEKHYKVKPIIYTSPRFWDEHFHKNLSGYPLWIAEYGVDQPSLPEGWETWHIWQFTQKGEVAGVEKPVDLNKLNTIDLNLNLMTIP